MRHPLPPPAARRARLAHTAVLGALCLAPPAGRGAAAQPPPARNDAPPSTRTDPFCWRGRPLPRCRAFALFELGYHDRVASTHARQRFPGFGDERFLVAVPALDDRQVTWTLGAMRNLDPHTALGGVLMLGPNGGAGGILGAQTRYRRWLGRVGSAEIGAGPAYLRVANDVEGSTASALTELRWGAAVDARVSYADRVGVGVRLLAVPSDGRLHAGLLAGGNVGSGLAVAGTVGYGILLGLVILALSQGDY